MLPSLRRFPRPLSGPTRPTRPTRPATGRRRPRRLVVIVLTVVGALLAGAGATAWHAYQTLDDNIASQRIDQLLGPRPEPAPVKVARTGAPRRALNVLLLGSDTRAGANVDYGGPIRGARADVSILLHLSADRTRAVGVSIPRDSMVQVPRCQREDGSTTPAALDLFNSAYTRGGVACTVRTVEALTGIRVDHFAVVDFEGFRSMVDAVGSVPVCVPRPVYDRYSRLSLRAGKQDISGEMALAYVRARDFDGGSDLDRIERQQKFLASLVRTVTSLDVLGNPIKLYGFLDAATRSVTTDPELADLKRLAALAQSVQHIGLDKVQFLTVPWRAYPPNPNRLQWSPKAAALWQALRTDTPLPRGEGFETRSAAQSSCS